MPVNPGRGAARALAVAATARGAHRATAGARAARALSSALGVEVVALVLLGSHAHRVARRESDLDVLAVTDAAPAVEHAVEAPGVDVDLRVVPLDDFLRHGLPPWYCVGPLPVLFDPRGHARHALRVARALYAAGPTPLSAAQRSRLRRWAERMERRVAAELTSDPPLAVLRMARLRVRLVELYFELRALWPLVDRAAMDHFRRNDPVTLRAFEAVADARSSAAELAAVRRLRARAFVAR